MELTRFLSALACLTLLLGVTVTSAAAAAAPAPDPQLFGLLRDRLPAALSARTSSTTSTTTPLPAPASAEPQAASLSPSIQALNTLQALHNLQALQSLQNLQNLHTAVERAKRSGNILQLLGGASGSSSGGATADAPYPASLGAAAPAYGAPAPAPAGGLGSGSGLLGGRGILGALLGSSSSNSASTGLAVNGKGPTYGNYIGTGAGLPMVYGQRSFDFQSFRQSLLGVLMTAVRAITGGVIALKGQLVRVKGQLLSAKGNIISASGEALSQFGRNIASNALRPKPPENPAPPRPVYGPPSYMGVLPIPRPVYGPPMYVPPGPISYAPMAVRPVYGVPGLPGAQHPVFNIYGNTISHDQPRYQPSFPPPPKAPSVPTYSSHSVGGAPDSYGPPPSGTPFSSGVPSLSSGTSFSSGVPSLSSGTSYSGGGSSLSAGTSYTGGGSSLSSGTPFSSGGPSLSSGTPFSSGGSSLSSGTSYSGGGNSLSSGTTYSTGGSSIPTDTYSSGSPSSQNQPSDSYGAPEALNSLSYSQSDSIEAPEPSGQQSDTYFKRNTNQGRDSDLSPLNALQGAHAGILLLKPVKNTQAEKQQVVQGSSEDFKDVQKEPQTTYYNLPQSLSTGSGYASQTFGSKIGESVDTQVNANERTLSLLFGSKKPKPLRPHPVTRALPPQVIAAASAKLAAQLDLAGRAPPRTAVAVSGPQGKFIMYHK